MTTLAAFLQFNLLPSLVVGAVVWLLVVAAFKLLPVRQAIFRLCLLWIPLLKSLLLLLGIGLILPWPESLFRRWHASALPADQVLPLLLIWAGGATLCYGVVVRRIRRRLLQGVEAPPKRLARVLDEVLAAYQKTARHGCTNGLRCSPESGLQPDVFVSDGVHSPLALITGGEPVILFPAGLVEILDDDELAGALAHEVTHFGLRWPGWCSVGALRKLALVSPVAVLASFHIYREEEHACDDMAITITGDRERYAGMLLKSYRYAQAHRASRRQNPAFLPHLLGRGRFFSNRVERLLCDPTPTSGHLPQSLFTLLLWLVASLLIFQF